MQIGHGTFALTPEAFRQLVFCGKGMFGAICWGSPWGRDEGTCLCDPNPQHGHWIEKKI